MDNRPNLVDKSRVTVDEASDRVDASAASDTSDLTLRDTLAEPTKSNRSDASAPLRGPLGTVGRRVSPDAPADHSMPEAALLRGYGLDPATLDPFAGWTVPDGWTLANIGHCRGCGAAIAWTRTPAGRHAPLDRDGVSHFATCPDAERFRRAVNLRRSSP